MRLAVVVDVLEELLAGQVLAAPDDRREAPVAQADLVLAPGLAAEPEADRASPSTVACRSRSVVSPNERLSRAYSSLPTRISVVSSSRTTAASTFSRGRPGRARSASHALADARQDARRRR